MMKNKLIEAYGLINTDEAEGEVDFEKDHFKVAFFNMTLSMKDGTPAQIPGCDHLYVGSIGSAYNLEGLRKAGITHILCLSNVIMSKYEDKFYYMRVPMID